MRNNFINKRVQVTQAEDAANLGQVPSLTPRGNGHTKSSFFPLCSGTFFSFLHKLTDQVDQKREFWALGLLRQVASLSRPSRVPTTGSSSEPGFWKQPEKRLASRDLRSARRRICGVMAAVVDSSSNCGSVDGHHPCQQIWLTCSVISAL